MHIVHDEVAELLEWATVEDLGEHVCNIVFGPNLDETNVGVQRSVGILPALC